MRGEQERMRARAGPESREGVRARERKRVVGRLGQQRTPGCSCRARSVRAAVSCLRGVREVVEEGGDKLLGLAGWACRCGREGSRGEVRGDGGGAGELTCRQRKSGRSSRPSVPCEPAVFLFVLSAGLGDSERTPARAGWALGCAGCCVGSAG